MRMLLTAVSIIIFNNQAVQASDDPFADAKAGKIECFSPNTEKKTCFDFSHYTWQADGTVIIEDEVALSANPLISVKTKSVSTVEKSSVCTKVLANSQEYNTFFKDGKPMSTEESAPLQQNLISNRSRFIGRTVCMDISPYESVYIAEFTIDGTPLPTATNRMKWIGTDEGYTLAP